MQMLKSVHRHLKSYCSTCNLYRRSWLPHQISVFQTSSQVTQSIILKLSRLLFFPDIAFPSSFFIINSLLANSLTTLQDYIVITLVGWFPVRWKKYSTWVYQTYNSQTQFHLLSTFSKSEYELYVKKQCILVTPLLPRVLHKIRTTGVLQSMLCTMMLYLQELFVSTNNKFIASSL